MLLHELTLSERKLIIRVCGKQFLHFGAIHSSVPPNLMPHTFRKSWLPLPTRLRPASSDILTIAPTSVGKPFDEVERHTDLSSLRSLPKGFPKAAFSTSRSAKALMLGVSADSEPVNGMNDNRRLRR